MTLNERILDFLDGSLPPDDEAELLHTLSVSPEQRSVLRDFMEQRALFTHDSKTLSVPYPAEQRLWTRLDQIMPIELPAEQPVLVPFETNGAQNAGFFARTLRGTRQMASALTLFAGIGIGYFVGTNANHNKMELRKISYTVPMQATATSSPAVGTIAATAPTIRRTVQISKHAAPAMISASIVSNLSDLSHHTIGENQPTIEKPQPTIEPTTTPQEPLITKVPAPISPAITMNEIGGDGGGIKPMFHKIHAASDTRSSFLSRFEFRVNESIGREFPNNVETNVSQPFITNTSVSAFFQVLPHSSLLWAGAGFGTANVTQKQLYITPGDPIDPSQQVLAADTSHAQTSYFSAMAELRLPAFETTDLTFDAGYGLASLGQMLFGEIGLHYNISEGIGTQFGLRVLRFSYDLNGEKNAAIQSGTSGLAVSNAVVAATPSFNTELNMGLFFHF